jgi:hypothetical protein
MGIILITRIPLVFRLVNAVEVMMSLLTRPHQLNQIHYEVAFFPAVHLI